MMEAVRTAAIAARNLILGANLKSLHLLTRPRAAVYYAGECLFLHRVQHPNGDIPQKEIWEVFGVNSEIPIVISPKAANQWFCVASYGMDLIGLCMLAQIVKPKKVFEIGTLEGSGALHLALNAPEAEIFTLDLAPNDVPALTTTTTDEEIMAWHRKGKNVFRDTPEEKRIHPVYGDSAQFDFSAYRGQIDLFFIDGSHSYEYVKNDTLKALDCVRKGGVIAWHDYGRYGVNGISRWLHEFRIGHPAIYRIPGGSLAYMIV
jgi:predicted O-methyltransferase YrrM